MTREEIRDLPKVELHVHLEGSTRPETLLKLAQRNGIALPASDLEGLKEWYQFRDFPHFVDVYTQASSAIRNAEDLELLVYEFGESRADNNILYTEATYTANTLFKQSGIPADEQRDALKRGRERALKDFEVDLRWIIDVVRETSVEEGEWSLEFALGAKEAGVVGFGLSGIEGESPVSRHRATFEAAKKAGLPVTAHAGETKGAESIEEVLKDAFADRIGHGIRCLEKPFLVQRLRDAGVPIEVNPTSNVCLKVVGEYGEHPLPELLNEGLNVSINSDDPAMFGADLSEEMFKASEAFGFDSDILYTLTMNAARAAFLPEEDRRALQREIAESW